jgi:hypothetical protein
MIHVVANTPTIQYLAGNVPGNEQGQGFFVCRFGRTSKRDCGQIVKELSSNESVATSKGGNTVSNTILKTIELNFDSLAGDSGGPVFSDLTETIGYGIHVHSDDETEPIPPGQATYRSWYVPLKWARATLIDERGVAVRWCISSDC